ncbi:MAG TPA: ferrous iron transporter B [Candidatus Copromonas avistercoris]|nr:ferrous iron transporter B [Candidatus Copromonas avistercoris]
MNRHIALVGNPNVGKSTIFNALTGLRQKTANWAGVTVSSASGAFFLKGIRFTADDLPGIYSLNVRSAEEAVTREALLTEPYDYLLFICDATCIERGLALLAQAAELLGRREAAFSSVSEAALSPGFPAGSPRAPQFLLCVNLCDEAERKGISIDFSGLEEELGIPVIPASARKKHGLDLLLARLSQLEDASGASAEKAPKFFIPGELAARRVRYSTQNYRKREERLDRFLTGRITGGLTMLLLLTAVFWLTMTGANYPSALLYDWLFSFEEILSRAAETLHAPWWLSGVLIDGVYRVTAWIVSVMLPPMAIFFPLFTLLEDSGYLPRVAFNMDSAFKKCRACGKQCLTMAMGLGCNAAGVTGCRIIDSPRERLIAILTNSLVPCNGRFPLLTAMISLFMARRAGSLFSALLLTGFILLSFGMSFFASWLLSHTVLKGVPSFFTLELPPYRRPQAGKVLVRSLLDRTIFVLGRAVTAAAPAGLLIWLLANITIGGTSLLSLLAGFLDPAGRLLGLDGVILMAFLLGFPANEIVLPIILMAYLETGTLVSMEDSASLYSLLTAHGWTVKTAVCMAVFSLFHWPCATTCLTIKKETGSLKWTAVSILLPAAAGCILCMMICVGWPLFFH